MAVDLIEALYLLQMLGVEKVSVESLIEVFLTTASVQNPEKEEKKDFEVPPELPKDLPPVPPAKPPVTVFKTYKEAKKAAKKGQTAAKDEKLGGWVLS